MASARAQLGCMTQIALLPERGVVEVTGADRVAFLQGLVSNDVTLAAPGEPNAAPGDAVWAALLTPQGRWLTDFFIFCTDDGEDARLLLDAPRAAIPDLIARLSRYRLRAQASLRDASEAWHVQVAWDGPAPMAAEGVVAADPRLSGAGWRVLSPAPLAANASAADWQARRLALGLPEPADLEAEKTLLLEANFDALDGISWTKGCYMGQEVTARTRFRGLVKRRLVPVTIACTLPGEIPAPGTPVLAGTETLGTLRSACRTGPESGLGLAMLRLDFPAAGPLHCGTAELVAHPPAWLPLPAPAARSAKGPA